MNPLLLLGSLFGMGLWVFVLIDIYIYPRLMAWAERNAIATNIGFSFSTLEQALTSTYKEGCLRFASTPRGHINHLNIDLGLKGMYWGGGVEGIAAIISAETLHMVLKKIGQWEANNALDGSKMHSLDWPYQRFAEEGFGLALPSRLD